LQAVHTPCNKDKKASIFQEGYSVVKDVFRAIDDGTRVSKMGNKNNCSFILDDND